jgi:capsid protein
MTPEQLQELALNLSSVTQHLRRQNEGATAQITQASQQLDRSASRLSSDVDTAHRQGQKSMQREVTNAEQFLQKAQSQLLTAQKGCPWT